MNLMGTVVKNYNFMEVIGSGSFGTVYKVLKDGTYYAAKVFSDAYVKQQLKDEDNRIFREIEALKKADGEMLIKYIDDFVIEGLNGEKFYTVVMEYFESINLKKYIDGLEVYDEQLVLEVFNKILTGIKQLHGLEIIHRDLKPANILINDNLDIKIVDYGLSKLIDYSTLTLTGAQMGSPLYMSPEQCIDSKNIDYRSDIFSLGVILYHMSTKTLPFIADNIPELINKILSEPLPSPKDRNKYVSDHLERVLYKATQKQNYNRYPSISEFMKSLYDSAYFAVGQKQHKSVFYPFIMNEKTVLETYCKNNDSTIIYQIHLKHWAKSVHKMVEDKEVDAIVDPSTHKLSYEKFMDTKGLMELPYAPKEGVISLEFLRNPANRVAYIESWYNHIENFNKVILPYHYSSNSTYRQDDVDEWLSKNIQLIEESNLYLREIKSKKTRFVMITLEFEHLVYEKKKILSYYTSIDTDYYVVQISDIKLTSGRAINEYIDFVRTLQQATGKHVIALRIPVSLGLALIAHGVHGFSTGLAGGENFKEDYIKKETETYSIYAKYFVDSLLGLLSYPSKESYGFKKVYDYFYPAGCECLYCNSKEWDEIAIEKNRIIQLHYLKKINDVVESLNTYDNIDERLDYFKGLVAKALNVYKDIPKSVINNYKNEKFNLLKNLYDILI